MNPLQRLIQDWMDADPSHKVGLLVQRAQRAKKPISRNTIYSLLDRDEPAGLPQRKTMEALAAGMGMPLATVEDAARRAAGYGIKSLESGSPELKGWLALLEELPDDRLDELWDIANMYLRRAKEEP